MNATADATSTTPPLAFEPPGPGSWQADTSHQSTARGHLMDELFNQNFTEGFRDVFARYGMPLETIDAKTVHGWLYTKAKPVGAPDGGGGPPPDLVLKIASRLIPEMRRRNRTARRALADQLWLRDAEAWTEERTEWIRKGESLLAEPIDQHTDAELEAHVRQSVGVGQRMLRRHFALLGPAVATGRLLVASEEWGLERSEVFATLRGASPESAATIGPLHELAALVAASGERPTTAEALAALSPEIAQRAGDYLRTWGWRILGDDIEAPTLMDNPDQLVSLISAVTLPADDLGLTGPDAIGVLRTRVPSSERSRFDQLVDEARRSYGSLDDNSGVTNWLMGVLRRAVLEVARRAASSGRLFSEHDVFNLSVNELCAMAGGGPGPSHEVMAERAAERAAAIEPPPWLGVSPAAPPDAAVFPKPMREMVGAFGAFMAGKFGGDGGNRRDFLSGRLLIRGATVASGHGVGMASVTARVVVATDPADAMDRLEPGNILICPFTTSGWVSVFPLLGGLVTAHGGPISHAGVMAREFGLSAVIGVGTVESHWDGSTATLHPTIT